MINQKLYILLVVGKLKKDTFKVGGKNLKSRLIIGTGKYKSFSETAKAVKASIGTAETELKKLFNTFSSFLKSICYLF